MSEKYRDNKKIDDQDGLTIEYSLLANYKSADKIDRKTLSISSFVAQFHKPIIGTKESVPAYVLTIFGNQKNAKGQLRYADNAGDYTGLVLDFDNKGKENFSFNEAIEKLDKKYFFIAHTTFSHTIEKNRFRIIIPFESPIPKDCLSVVFDYFAKLLNAGDALDPSSKTISQPFILPACSKSNYKSFRFFAASKKAKIYDPSDIVKRTSKEKRKPKKVSIAQDRSEFVLPNINLDQFKIPDDINQLILTGNAEKYNNDRSALGFNVIASLCQITPDDAAIAAILLHKKHGINERYIEKGKDWTLEEIRRVRRKAKAKLVSDVDPHYPEPDYLDISSAQNKLKKAITKFFKGLSGARAIAAPAGLGKTRLVIDEIARIAPHRFIEYYAKDHKLACQIAKDLSVANPALNVVVIRGRTHRVKEDHASEPLCKKSALVTELSKYGYSIYNSVCKKCEYFSTCQYLAQFKDDTHVRIFTHSSIPIKRGLLDKRTPDFVIIDEAFYSVMIENHKFSLPRIENLFADKELAKIIVQALSDKKPLLTELRTTYGSNVSYKLLTEADSLNVNLPHIDDVVVGNEVSSKGMSTVLSKQKLSTMLRQLEKEFQWFPDREHSISVRKADDKLQVAQRLSMSRFVRWSTDRANKDRELIPILYLDADYSKRITSVFIPGIKRVKVSVKRNVHVVQVSSTTNAKQRFIPPNSSSKERQDSAVDHIQTIQSIIEQISKKHGKTLVVGYKGLNGDLKARVDSLIKLPKNCEFIHFGALRGLNDFTAYDAAVIIGRHQLPVSALESQAAALFWDSDRELVFTGKPSYELRGYRVKNKKVGLHVSICDDPRVQLLQELSREKETLQAIDRLRLIHNLKKKHVYILCNVPLDITVDKLVSQKQLRKGQSLIEQALEATKTGILPINPSFLVKNYPNIFPSINIANKALKVDISAGIPATGINSESYIELLYRKWNLIEIKVKGKRGKHTLVLADRKISESDVISYLKKLFKSSVEIVKSIKRNRRS